MWLRWRFSTVSNAEYPPSAPRATTALISSPKSMNPSRISGFGDSAANAPGRSPAWRSIAWPLPS